MAKISNVGVHNLSPGMVTTELLMSGANTPTAKFFINCLGEARDRHAPGSARPACVGQSRHAASSGMLAVAACKSSFRSQHALTAVNPVRSPMACVLPAVRAVQPCTLAAEEPGDVAAFLVPRIREVPPTSATLAGGIASTYIQYLTKPKAFSQIITVRALRHALSAACVSRCGGTHSCGGRARLHVRDCGTPDPACCLRCLPPLCVLRPAAVSHGRAQEPLCAGGVRQRRVSASDAT